MEEINIVEEILYKSPGTAFVKVRKGEFREKVVFESLHGAIRYNATPVRFEKVMKDGYVEVVGIYEVEYSISVFNTFTPVAQWGGGGKELSKEEIKEHVVVGYDNPYKDSVVNKRLICNIAWLGIINRGIDEVGVKKAVNYIMKSFVQGNSIGRRIIEGYFRSALDTDARVLLDNLNKSAPHKMANKIVFYSDNSDPEWEKPEEEGVVESNCHLLDYKDKRKISMDAAYRKVRLARKALLDVSIELLVKKDRYTKITVNRLSRESGLQRKAVVARLGFKQKRTIKRLNILRPFMSEEVTEKCAVYIDGYDVYGGYTLEEMCEEFRISKNTAIGFRKLYGLVMEADGLGNLLGG